MRFKFLLQFLRHPRSIGAVVPSSRGLARRMVADIDLSDASVVVEYGPGTGALTGEILKALKPGALFFAIESNAILFESFRQRFPDVTVFNESAANVAALLEGLGAEKADCVLSGLPWASFTATLQDTLLEATLEALGDGGRFVTFAYLQGLLLPSGQSFKRKLQQRFGHVGRSSIAWANLPPAFVYRCVKRSNGA